MANLTPTARHMTLKLKATRYVYDVLGAVLNNCPKAAERPRPSFAGKGGSSIKNKRPVPCFRKERGVTLATSYFRTTYRGTIIGAAAFHFRVRNGNGWCHCAGITRRLG